MKLRARPKYQAVSLDEGAEEDMEPLSDRIAASGLSPEQLCERAEVHELVSRMVERLSPKQRHAYELCAIDGLSIHEASCTLGIAESALKCRLARARATLIESLRNGGLRPSAEARLRESPRAAQNRVCRAHESRQV
jgi:DNA-directed RNA polymerase specialized sigma24 family protein